MKQQRRVRDRRLAFAREYIIDLHVAAAMVRAGYSARSASAQGTKLLHDPLVQAEIARLQAQTFEHAALRAERVLEEYRRIAFSDLLGCFEDDGRLKRLKDMPRDMRAAIASIKSTKKNLTAGDGVMEDVVEIRLWDKTRALNDLARHFALLTDVVQVSGDVTLTEKIARARARGAQLLAERAKG